MSSVFRRLCCALSVLLVAGTVLARQPKIDECDLPVFQDVGQEMAEDDRRAEVDSVKGPTEPSRVDRPRTLRRGQGDRVEVDQLRAEGARHEWRYRLLARSRAACEPQRSTEPQRNPRP